MFLFVLLPVWVRTSCMVRTRATNPPLVDFDWEIDRTYHCRLREQRIQPVPMAGNANQTLRQLTAANITQQAPAVTIPALGNDNLREQRLQPIPIVPPLFLHCSPVVVHDLQVQFIRLPTTDHHISPDT